MTSAPAGNTASLDRQQGPRTVAEAFDATVRRVPDRVALRTLNGQTTVSWAEYGHQVRHHGSVLAALGVKPGERVGLMMANCPVFHYLDVAAVCRGAVPVSIYNTLPAADIAWLLQDAAIEVVFAEAAFVPLLRKATDLCGRPQVIVCVDSEQPGTAALLGLLRENDPPSPAQRWWHHVSPESPVTVSYTSGTTGPPKGVVLSHRAILGSLAALDQVIGTVEGARVVSFLPMAHVAERMFSHYRGIVHGLTITCCPDTKLVLPYLVDARPHYVFSPPRLFEKIHTAIEVRAAQDDAVRAAITTGLAVVDAAQAGEPIPSRLSEDLAEATSGVFRPLLAEFGLDEIVLAMTGSAPVPPGLVRFFLALGVPALEGWGMSECAAFGSINRPDNVRAGSVGFPLTGLALKLLDDGEIVLRSPWLMTEYLNRPELTAATIDSEGWLHTGDIGSLDADGRLRIIDRKKELIISAFGKNMSPANIEAQLLQADPIIGQAAVIGDARPYNTALLVLNTEVAAAIVGDDVAPAALATHPGIQAAVERAVSTANQHLSRVEGVKKYALLTAEWLPGGDELSPTMKLKRKAIDNKYAQLIDELYAQGTEQPRCRP